MESTVLKTLQFADEFGFPLKAWEVHKWLIKKRASLITVEKALIKLEKKGRISQEKGFYFLSGKKGLIPRRRSREKEYKRKLITARIIGNVFRIIPKVGMFAFDGSFLTDGERIDEHFWIVNKSDYLFCKSKNLESAYKILQMKLLWQKQNLYSKFLEENEWVFEYFPNWTSAISRS